MLGMDPLAPSALGGDPSGVTSFSDTRDLVWGLRGPGLHCHRFAGTRCIANSATCKTQDVEWRGAVRIPRVAFATIWHVRRVNRFAPRRVVEDCSTAMWSLT